MVATSSLERARTTVNRSPGSASACGDASTAKPAATCGSLTTRSPSSSRRASGEEVMHSSLRGGPPRPEPLPWDAQASEPSSAASLRQNSPGTPAGSPLDPDG
ncbi:hypothetical protein [Ornithinimicrobium kibberense]|uniref:hypothetical protein n=1 Tax=Ornithinimicrobium kibberense TaxID=282060 RepID=UPI0036132616